MCASRRKVLRARANRIIPEDDFESRFRPTIGERGGRTFPRVIGSLAKGRPMASTLEAVAYGDSRYGAAPVVVADDLSRRYGSGDTAVDALRGVSLDVAPGELVAVMGPSGSGKSTLMHILAGLDRPTSGTVSIGGVEIGSLNDNQLTRLRRKHIGFVFQFFNLLPMLTAEENVLLPLSIAGRKPDEDWVDELLAVVGLDGRRNHRPAELSGGQQQRVAVARALVSRPTVLFADEPTGNLDSQTSAEILDLLRVSSADYGQTTVMVTHDPRAATIADRIFFLADGAIVRRLDRSSQAQVLETLHEVTPR
jgi:putative ABC transport system ATP-binding protein